MSSFKNVYHLLLQMFGETSNNQPFTEEHLQQPKDTRNRIVSYENAVKWRRRSVNTTACLAPLVKAVGYRGSALQIEESKPHFRSEMDITDLRAALVNLGYATECHRIRPCQIDQRLMPCLYEFSSGDVAILFDSNGAVIHAFLGGKKCVLTPEEASSDGRGYFLKPAKSEGTPTTGSWTLRLLRRFNGYFLQLLAISAISNLLGIAAPLFIMVIYDKVIALRALDIVPLYVSGIAFVIAMDLYFKSLRAHLLGAIASRLDYLITSATFAKLIRLPLSLTNGPPISTQVSRLKEFQSVRDLLAGPAASAIVDFPFTIFALAAIAFVAGWLVIAPIAACVVFALTGYLGTKWLQFYERSQSDTAKELFGQITDATLNFEAIKREGAENIWFHRFRLKSAAAATRAFELQSRSTLLEDLSPFLSNMAALAILGTGTIMVLNGGITLGALIASMALTWRILGPAQQLFQTLARLSRLTHSIRAMDQMLRLPDESDGTVQNIVRTPKEGRIAFQRACLRYGSESELAISNINMVIPARKTVAIVGPNASGKSSLFRALTGVYPTNSGSISIDGVDIRQYPPAMLRRAVAAVPQEAHLFYGTIAQNLRIADPLASDESLAAAATDAGILEIIQRMPNGFDTLISDVDKLRLSTGFLRQLTIARALIRNAPIFLLDEPEAMLDDEGANAVGRLIERMHGKKTFLLISHRPSFIKLADFAVFMRNGTIEYGGKPEAAIERLFAQTGNIAA